MPETTANRHSMWMGIAGGFTTFLVTAIATIFLFGRQIGSLRQELNDLVAWKREAAPAITRIDRSGSLSFENFRLNYDKEQAKQYDRIQNLETEVGHLDKMELRIDRLEAKVGKDGNSERQP